MSTIPLAIVFPYLVIIVIVFVVLWVNIFQNAIDTLIAHQDEAYHEGSSCIGTVLWIESTLLKVGSNVLEEAER